MEILVEIHNTFRSPQYESIQSGIRTTWLDPNKPMRDLSSGNIDILDPDQIITIVFGHPLVKMLITFFNILSAISGAAFLLKLLKKAKPCVTPRIDLNLNAPAFEQELQQNVNRNRLGDWDSHLNDVEGELPPAYESTF